MISNNPIVKNPSKKFPTEPHKATDFVGLKHKNGRDLSDVEYMLLLHLQAEELRSEGKDPGERYGDIVVRVADTIAEEKAHGATNAELKKYLSKCIEL